MISEGFKYKFRLHGFFDQSAGRLVVWKWTRDPHANQADCISHNGLSVEPACANGIEDGVANPFNNVSESIPGGCIRIY